MSYSLILPFDSDNEDFVRGFEAGRIWVLMEENPEKLKSVIFHAVNAEMVMRMLEQKGLAIKVNFTDDERWMKFDDPDDP